MFITLISISAASAEDTADAYDIGNAEYTDIYVSVDGAGTGDGSSSSNPKKFADLEWNEENVHVHMLDGSYDTTFSISKNNTVISAVNKEKVVFNYNNGGSTISASNVYLIGLTFTSNNRIPLTISNPSNVLTSNINILGCTFKDCELRSSGAALEIRGNCNGENEMMLTDVNIKDSKFYNIRGHHDGPAIYGTYVDNLEIVNCEFKNNYVYEDSISFMNGGVVSIEYSNMITVINSSFISNTATKEMGGALYVSSKGLLCEGCTFTGNTGNQGGALFLKYDPSSYKRITTNTKYLINNCVFERNTAISRGTCYAYGGAVHIRDHCIITNCTFTGNIAKTSYQSQFLPSGGAVFLSKEKHEDLSYRTDSIINCTFINNRAYDGGGLFIWHDNTLIINCTFIKNNALEMGGGMCVSTDANNATIINCTFLENYGTYVAGGLFIEKSQHCTVDNCTFYKNSATYQGGAIQADGSYNSIINSEFDENTASSGGAIILLESTKVTIDNCTFNKNTAKSNGGAILTESFDSCILNSEFNDNSAALGGAVAITYRGKYLVDNCTFNRNAASNQGGGILTNMNNITIINSEFNENTAQTAGGGIVMFGTAGNIVENCTFDKNNAQHGGGIEVRVSADTRIENCTFNENTATQQGAGINDQANSTLILNSEFNKNDAPLGGGICIGPNALNTLVNECEFVENTGTQADSKGGAIMTASKYSTIANSTFTNNSASWGGAIEYENDDGIIANCEFAENKAAKYGGAINFGGNGTVANSRFVKNEAQARSTIYNTGRLNLDKNTIETEFAEIYNDGLIVSPTTLTVLDNKTVDTLLHKNEAITSVLVDDNENRIVSGNLTHTIEGEVFNPDFDEYGIYKHYYAPARSGIIPVYGNYGNATQLTIRNGRLRVIVPAKVNVTAHDIIEGQVEKLNISFASDEVVGNLTVTVGDQEFNIELNGQNYTGTLYIPGLKSGTYNVTVFYEGDEFHTPAENSTTFKVYPLAQVNVTAHDIIEGDVEKLNISFASDEVVGNLTVIVGDQEFTIELNGQNYTGTLEVPGLKRGTYNVTVIYKGDEYHPSAENSTTFKVFPPAQVNVTAHDIIEGDVEKLNISFASDEVVGNLTVIVGDQEFTIELNGQNYTGTLEVPGLKRGTYNVTVIYKGDEYHPSAENSTTFNVFPPADDLMQNILGGIPDAENLDTEESEVPEETEESEVPEETEEVEANEIAKENAVIKKDSASLKTGNPLLVLLVALFAIPIIRRKK